MDASGQRYASVVEDGETGWKEGPGFQSQKCAEHGFAFRARVADENIRLARGRESMWM